MPNKPADKVGGYVSDCDLLQPRRPRRYGGVLGAAEDQLMRASLISKLLTAPANFIVHSLADVNRQLGRGRPFFIDILCGGTALYEAEGHPFGARQPVDNRDVHIEARGHDAECFRRAGNFLTLATDARDRSMAKESASFSIRRPNAFIIASCWP